MSHTPIIATLHKQIQKLIVAQDIWGFGHNSDMHINLNARLFIPPSDKVSLDFLMSFELSTYHPSLLVQYNNKSEAQDIGNFVLNDDDVLDQMNTFVNQAIKDYDNRQDRNFESKLRNILGAACVFQHNAYYHIYKDLPKGFVLNITPDSLL